MEARASALDDELMCLDFLHAVVLYDTVIMDDSSLYLNDGAPGFHKEIIFNFIARLNEQAGYDLIRPAGLARFDTPMAGFNEGWDEFRAQTEIVASGVCDLIRQQVPASEASSFYVPWAYRSDAHCDHEMFVDAAARTGLHKDLLPLAKFAFRGLYYADIAADAANRLRPEVLGSGAGLPVVYSAAPFRLRILERVCSADDLERVKAPQAALQRVREVLPGVSGVGYRFASIRSLPSPITSPLSGLLTAGDQVERIGKALKMRAGTTGSDLRERWSDLLFDSDVGDKLVGRSAEPVDIGASQSVSGVNALFVFQRQNLLMGKSGAGRPAFRRREGRVHGRGGGSIVTKRPESQTRQPRQNMEDLELSGAAQMRSDAPGTNQNMRKCGRPRLLRR